MPTAELFARLMEIGGGADPGLLDTVAQAWAVLRAKLHAAGKTAFTNDSWIAATAIARGIPVATRDSDYDDAGVRVIRI